MTLHVALAFVLAAWALGVLLGHAAGYARAKRVFLSRYRRVGTPE